MKEERTFIIDGKRISAEVERDGDILRVTVDGQTHTVEIEGSSAPSKIIRSRRGRSGTQNENSGSIVSSIPGKVVSIDVKVGDIVEKGQTILILEAMK
ncbi:MAG: biotin/lipoyl-binding protein, partial [Candidatus Thermoplasmatota archaeon]|nr:biotin/lipoyl-binding protein [Candidatus Thermoplasmatota archaeon]